MHAASTVYFGLNPMWVSTLILAVTYAMGFFSPKHLGAGQFYLMTIKDKAGQRLDGAASYRLTVPPNAPVKLYWSATVYDNATHALIREMNWSSRGSNTPGLQKNADGSVKRMFVHRRWLFGSKTAHCVLLSIECSM